MQGDYAHCSHMHFNSPGIAQFQCGISRYLPFIHLGFDCLHTDNRNWNHRDFSPDRVFSFRKVDRSEDEVVSSSEYRDKQDEAQ